MEAASDEIVRDDDVVGLDEGPRGTAVARSMETVGARHVQDRRPGRVRRVGVDQQPEAVVGRRGVVDALPRPPRTRIPAGVGDVEPGACAVVHDHVEVVGVSRVERHLHGLDARVVLLEAESVEDRHPRVVLVGLLPEQRIAVIPDGDHVDGPWVCRVDDDLRDVRLSSQRVATRQPLEARVPGREHEVRTEGKPTHTALSRPQRRSRRTDRLYPSETVPARPPALDRNNRHDHKPSTLPIRRLTSFQGNGLAGKSAKERSARGGQDVVGAFEDEVNWLMPLFVCPKKSGSVSADRLGRTPVLASTTGSTHVSGSSLPGALGRSRSS